MSNKHKNSKKKMASLGLRKDENGDYKYIDPNVQLQNLFQ